jgi:hypothetical protein
MQRTSCDVRVLNNTVVNLAPSGRCVSLGPGTEGVVVANTMDVAPFRETGSQGTAGAFVLDADLGSSVFAHNLWAEPLVVGWGGGWHYLWPWWSDPEGYRSPEEWAALPQVSGDRYRRFAATDLDEEWRPLFSAELGAAQAGVHTDLHGDPRPLAGTVSVGAVETPGTPAPGDADGDGSVNAGDFSQVLMSWGPCTPTPAPCPADLTGDGDVDEADLLLVLMNWESGGD